MRAVDVIKLKTPKSKEFGRRMENSVKALEGEIKDLKARVASLEKLLVATYLKSEAKVTK